MPDPAALRLAVLGAGGRMGRLLVAAVSGATDVALAGAVEHSASPFLGQDAGNLAGVGPLGIAVTADVDAALATADGVLDFTRPDATIATARIAAAWGLIHVIGTTGLEPEHVDVLRDASTTARIVQSGNMSLGVNVLAILVRDAARALGTDWDIEIVEMHHRMKVDAPSGTALLLGEAAAAGRGVTLAEHSDRGRDGETGARRRGDIGFASLRGGSVVGEHSVMFAGTGERIELGHRAEDRGLFARGAIQAALWVRDRPAGYYGMADVLGLSGRA